MSKKTAPKTPKKPPYSAKNEIGRLWTQSKMQRETNKIHRERLEKQMSALDKRLTALESRSAPAEEWVPKVGDHIILTEYQDTSLKKGEVCEVLHVGKIDAQVQSLCPTAGDGRWWVGLDRIRSATSQEIADHKAKEEQRVRENERAKELAKPLRFGVPVKVDKSAAEWVYLRASTTNNTDHLLAHCDGTLMIPRDKFTVID